MTIDLAFAQSPYFSVSHDGEEFGRHLHLLA